MAQDLTTARLLQLKQASVFYMHAIHTVHVTKKDCKAAMKERELGMRESLQHVTDKAVRINRKGKKKTCRAWDNVPACARGEAALLKGEVLEIPSVPQLFPDAVSSSSKSSRKVLGGQWVEPVDVLLTCAEILFDDVKSFDSNEDHTVEVMRADLFNKIWESSIEVDGDRAANSDPFRGDEKEGRATGWADVDLFLWHCLQFWSGIVKMRFLNIRRMTSWFGDEIGGKMISRGTHNYCNWKKLCERKLGLADRNFHKILEVRDQNDFFAETFHQVLLKAEQSFPLFVPGKSMHFGKLKSSFEAAILPAITLDLGGSNDIVRPLELHSDDVSHKAKALGLNMRLKEKKEDLAEKKTEKEGSFAERARKMQREKLGIKEVHAVIEELDDHVYFEARQSLLLWDAVDIYGKVINRWMEDGLTNGKPDDSSDMEAKAQLIRSNLAALAGLREQCENLQGTEDKDSHKLLRGHQHLAWETLRKTLSEVHNFVEYQAGTKNVTIEFLSDPTAGGRKVDCTKLDKIK